VPNETGKKFNPHVTVGIANERADMAWVVSNAAFTKSAKQLSNTTGVLLLHHDELPSMRERVALAG
jgi:restriction system protein